MAHLKSVVAEAVLLNGYAVLNADDPLPQWQKRVKSQVAYFTMNLNQLCETTTSRAVFGGV